ncbi:MAG: DUF4810 domain-containing protein [Zetaproteobacteria bacterium CG12_big_fil_rev_8_21_14_0_65_54_13]|nr:MAG: DUF4810 domain-containing protein [Zetaproteobacteria bacterium CG23_combo_of_CG06-09_8_20_14_all_54_7]PIW48762.1 MAG: DUF4810 domain-containing protein [Zetaproteobacteria bacterium CG12_big_fil_rev_8_21_14_0_65_54_13]PIX53243.1 MAG: DUF4810 domain-containing protein [Zetaproteobacteria bacterium CG_4_10_14_3_um_filter_54_28]PJA30566.1 MAG: DUF4810 domain-containing protein [Zetaproteobacteria bacterium CG_4_9_14_3_um_filter_54_145]
MFSLKSRHLLVIIFSLSLFSGCAKPADEIYYWGEYEQLIHDMYVEPGKADSAMQVEKLTADIQQAENTGKQVPPGLYAHLGMMYESQGKVAQGEAALLEEKKLYSESSVFIQGLIDRAAKENR